MHALSDCCGTAEFAGVGLWEAIDGSTTPAQLVAAARANFFLTTLRDFRQQHMPARALRSLVGEQCWSTMFTFAFVRNPWDLVVSTYYFSREHEASSAKSGRNPDRAELITRSPTFERFVDLYPALRSDMTAMLCDENGEDLVSFVGRYENLAADFVAVCTRLGIAAPLPRLNASERDRDYRVYYSARTRRIVEEHFARDIERFGYVF